MRRSGAGSGTGFRSGQGRGQKRSGTGSGAVRDKVRSDRSGAVRSGVSDGVRSGQGRGQAHYTYIMRQDLVVSSLLGEITLCHIHKDTRASHTALTPY